MSGTDLALALATGLVAAVNPCGFALLPAYLSLLVLDEGAGQRRAVRRALVLTAAMTAGFVAVFGVFGLLAAPVAGSVGRRLPWVTIVIGLLLVGLGGWLLAGRQIPAFVPKLRRGPAVTRSVPSMVLFGASFAIASLGCTVGPFLAVVVTSFTAGDVVAGIGLFLTYAAGMGLAVGTVAVAIALARTSLVARIRRATPVIARAAGVLLMLAGAYVAYYGWYEIRVFRGGVTGDPVVDAFGSVQSAVADWLGRAGAGRLSLALAVLLVIAAAVGAARRRAGRRPRRRAVATRVRPEPAVPAEPAARSGQAAQSGQAARSGPPAE
jgi:cytochrome c biogenesis protein CcdA